MGYFLFFLTLCVCVCVGVFCFVYFAGLPILCLVPYEKFKMSFNRYTQIYSWLITIPAEAYHVIIALCHSLIECREKSFCNFLTADPNHITF